MAQGAGMLACQILVAAYFAWQARHVPRWWRDRAALRQGRLHVAMLLEELERSSPRQ
jgi:hypothetical protein